jgi:nitrite reductase (NO-forming)
MSSHSSNSAFWAVATKAIATILILCAGYWPAVFIYGGLKARANQGKLVEVAQAAPSPMPAPAVTAASAPSTPASSDGSGDAALAAQMADGQKTYMLVCFACHQPTGLGLPNMFPPLAGSDWVTAPKADRIIRNVLHGVMGPLTINGKPFTTPAPMMPPQGAALSNKQVADVLTYIRNSWGNKASAVTADQVQAVREAEKARTAMWTEAELLKIADR